MTTTIRFILAFILSMGFVSNLYAAKRYCAPKPNADGSKCTQAQPCSLRTAINKAKAGDTVILGGGTYYPDRQILVGKTMVIKAKSGEKPIISGRFRFPAGFDTIPTTNGKKSTFIINGKKHTMKVNDKDDRWYTKNKYWYQGLIRVTAMDVIIDGLTVEKSTANGIDAQDANHIIIRNCTIRYNFNAGVRLGKMGGGSFNTIENSIVHNNDYIRDAGIWRHWTTITTNIGLHGKNSTARGNIVYGGPCAGIEDYQGDGSQVEDNYIYANGFTCVHLAYSRNTTIDNNVCVGAERTAYTKEYGNALDHKDGWGGLGIRVETWKSSNSNWDYGHRVTNNKVANCRPPLTVGIAGKDKHPENKLYDVEIDNNTFIGTHGQQGDVTKSQPSVMLRVIDKGHLGDDIYIRNNIFWGLKGFPLVQEDDRNAASKITFSNNLWNKPITARMGNPNNFKASTDPRNPDYDVISIEDYFQRSTGWNPTDATNIDENNFNLLSTAFHAIDQGVDLGSGDDIGANQFNDSQTSPPSNLRLDDSRDK